jgi:hypothetical protein
MNRVPAKFQLPLFSPVLFFILFAVPSMVFAHRLDEYLQATLVVIEPDRVRLQINLTPGVAVAEQVLAQIDRNRDGAISTNEAAAYCELLKRDFTVRLDQQDVKLTLIACYFPGPAELRTGLGFIQMEFSGSPGRLAAGAHTLTIENRHLASLSVYLVNAAQPASTGLQITRQIRNENQSLSEIQFRIQPLPTTRTQSWDQNRSIKPSGPRRDFNVLLGTIRHASNCLRHPGNQIGRHK